MRPVLAFILCVPLIAGCAIVPDGLFAPKNKPSEPAGEPLGLPPVEPVEPAQTPITTGVQTAEQLDETTPAERTAAVTSGEPVSGETDLGTTVASLGAVADQGIWLKTPLVSASGKGRVVYGKTGRSIAVDLLPLEGASGAGSQISLAAMRLLDADLTSLPELRVYRSQ